MTFGAVARRGGAWLPVIGFAALAGTLGTLALPAVLGKTVDAIVAGGSDTGYWLALAGGLIGLGVVCELIGAYAGTACVAGTTAWLRKLLSRHILAIGPDRGRRFDTGDLVSRVSNSCGEAAEAGPSVVTATASILPPIGSVVLLWYIDPWVAVTFLAGVALVGVVLWAFTRKTADVMTAYQQTQGRLSARLSESLSGARTIAAAGTSDQEVRRILDPLALLRRQGIRTWRVLSTSVAQSAIVGPLVLVGVVAVGGFELSRGRITAGELFAASQYAVLGAGLGSLTGVFGELARARAGVRRAREVFTVPPVEYGTRTLPIGPGRLEFRGVTVRAGDKVLLDDIDLTVPGACTVAVVGPSGAGKSVLAELTARLREPDEGEILLDGIPIRHLDRESFRTAVGCAFERPVPVGATIADAIGPGLDRREVVSLAGTTHAHDFIARLPEGYDTPLAEAPMSGGERQRLGLARAWRADRVLVLDDATSSLDMVTEMQISQTLTGSGKRAWVRTRLIVTHRAATAARADLVVWLSDGRVCDVGSHDRLWERPGYREVFG